MNRGLWRAAFETRALLLGLLVGFVLVMPAVAQADTPCAELYKVSGAVSTAYDNYDGWAARSGSAERVSAREAALEFRLSAQRFYAYGTAYLNVTESESGGDFGAAISQCDLETRLIFYEAGVKLGLFNLRTGKTEGKSYVDMVSGWLYWMMLAVQKSNEGQADLATLGSSLARFYASEHTAQSEDMNAVESYLRRTDQEP